MALEPKSAPDDEAIPDDKKKKRQDQLEDGNYFLVDTDTWSQGVDGAPLCQRGWVVQERALSVRTIHFGKNQLFWECMCEHASEVMPKGLLRGTKINDPKAFLVSGLKLHERRVKKLQSIREQLFRLKEQDEAFEERMRKFREERREFHEKMQRDFGITLDATGYSSESDDTTDEAFAKRLGTTRSGQDADATNSESDYNSDSYHGSDFEQFSKKPFKRKRKKTTLRSLDLYPRDFVGCDPSILDGLDIKGWNKFKKMLGEWNIGSESENFEPRTIRGMTFELRQWIMLIKIFSACLLTFSKDKLVAVSGMAQNLAAGMNCEYLAGLWRRDLEHQLLWKVLRPCPAPEVDHTRGPSWTWASVDGAIEIPEWSGYFSQ